MELQWLLKLVVLFANDFVFCKQFVCVIFDVCLRLSGSPPVPPAPCWILQISRILQAASRFPENCYRYFFQRVYPGNSVLFALPFLFPYHPFLNTTAGNIRQTTKTCCCPPFDPTWSKKQIWRHAKWNFNSCNFTCAEEQNAVRFKIFEEENQHSCLGEI